MQYRLLQIFQKRTWGSEPKQNRMFLTLGAVTTIVKVSCNFCQKNPFSVALGFSEGKKKRRGAEANFPCLVRVLRQFYC